MTAPPEAAPRTRRIHRAWWGAAITMGALFTSKPRLLDRWDGGSGMVQTFRIIDVDGERYAVGSVCDTTCTEEDFATLEEMAESVTFVRES